MNLFGTEPMKKLGHDMRICTIPYCNKKHEAKGFCPKHYERFRTYGDPYFSKYNIKRFCSVIGCDKKHEAKGFCQKHFNRFRKNQSLIDPVKTLNFKRYKQIRKPDHPLSCKTGAVYVHRMILYNNVQGCRLPCFWCGKPLDWFGIENEKLCVDHRDFDKHNNSVENLLPSCNSCNAGRVIGSKNRTPMYSVIE